jgi:hypothetical protein
VALPERYARPLEGRQGRRGPRGKTRTTGMTDLIDDRIIPLLLGLAA